MRLWTELGAGPRHTSGSGFPVPPGSLFISAAPGNVWLGLTLKTTLRARGRCCHCPQPPLRTGHSPADQGPGDPIARALSESCREPSDRSCRWVKPQKCPGEKKPTKSGFSTHLLKKAAGTGTRQTAGTSLPGAGVLLGWTQRGAACSFTPRTQRDLPLSTRDRGNEQSHPPPRHSA